MSAKRRIAIKTLAAFALATVCGLGVAGQVAGTIVNLSGPLMARKADGTVKVLAVKSEVEQGDTLVSERNTYAQIRFVDNSEITLKPGTTFRVEAFNYEQDKPASDSASFSLVKGGLRSVTGLLGKRNRERFQLKTPTATIGIRGTTFVAQWTPPGTPAGPQALAVGLHVSVLDGAIYVSNGAGGQTFVSGQFGYVPSQRMPPVLIPRDPGLKFTVPPTFSSNLVTSATTGGQGKAEAVDCEVR